MLAFLSELTFLSWYAALLIRIAVAVAVAIIAYRHMRSGARLRVAGVAEGLLALLLFAGLYTQVAAILAAVSAIGALAAPAYRAFPRSTLVLILVMSLSLIMTGAGPFAFDSPL